MLIKSFGFLISDLRRREWVVDEKIEIIELCTRWKYFLFHLLIFCPPFCVFLLNRDQIDQIK